MPKKSPSSKKKEKQEQSPSNSRSFTDLGRRFHVHVFRNEWKTIVFSFVMGVLVMGIIFIAVDILQALDTLEMKKQERVVLEEEIGKWEKIVSEHPDYRDGYFKLALLYYQSGKRAKAEENLIVVKNIDPQFTKAKILEERLKGR